MDPAVACERFNMRPKAFSVTLASGSTAPLRVALVCRLPMTHSIGSQQNRPQAFHGHGATVHIPCASGKASANDLKNLEHFLGHIIVLRFVFVS